MSWGMPIAVVFGAVFGTSELLTRYRDKPTAAVFTAAGLFYVLVNAAVSAGGLAVARIFNWSFGLASGASALQVETVQVVVTGFAAMAILRSTIFTIRVGAQDIGIGFNAVVQAFLRSADAAVDRRRGVERDAAAKVMDQVSFERAVVVLPSYCLGLMQNLSPDDQTALGVRIEFISKMTADDRSKSRLLGLAIVNVMGDQVLQAAVASLGDQIAAAAPRDVTLQRNPVVGVHQP